ncbi:hypothetical protein [Thioalkalivibrio sp. ALE16]|uniref:hypothetical protein n=1 Tax=Thioalkalivibrio sp. ALE16 TaxID=1158172 RepID=UPI00036732FA|nr:hypothetical protein [Thioalkalivibrio sp. ALE16]
MFNLIIVIISISLVAALAIATLFYGGSVFSNESANAESSRILNEANQIVSAVNLRSIRDKSPIENLEEDLIPRYIQVIPEGWDIDVEEGSVSLDGSLVSIKACELVNERQGATRDEFGIAEEDPLIPVCTDAAESKYQALCCNSGT